MATKYECEMCGHDLTVTVDATLEGDRVIVTVQPCQVCALLYETRLTALRSLIEVIDCGEEIDEGSRPGDKLRQVLAAARAVN